MNHALRFAPAALACALSVSTSCAWSHDTSTDATTGTNVFRAERRAVDDVRIRRDARGGRDGRFAAPASRSPFDTPDTRELRISGGRLTPRSPDHRADDDRWAAARAAIGAGGGDSLGRRVPEHERRILDWDAYLRATDTRLTSPNRTFDSYSPRAPLRRFDGTRGVPGTPNPFDPSVPQPETRTFYDNGAGTRCTATGGGSASRSSCNIRW
nr:hypothetical protein [Burkholderia ubonensis]